MDDQLAFLDQLAAPDSTATLRALLPDGSLVYIEKVSPLTVLPQCPLLYHAFEFGAHSIRQADIQATSFSGVASLLSFLYCGSYDNLPGQDPESLLLHADVYKTAQDFDVPELQVQAYVNFATQLELACSTASPPSDLCATVTFLYEHLASNASQDEHSLVDTVLNYCLTNFKYQGLGDWQAFRQVVFQNPDFLQDLCRMSMQRNFEDAGAADIMHLPVCFSKPYSQEERNKRVLGDFEYELWQEFAGPACDAGADMADPGPKKRRKVSDIPGQFTLVHRPKNPTDAPLLAAEADTDTEAQAHTPSNEELDFELVHRPKPDCNVSSTPVPRSPTVDAESPVLVSADSQSESVAAIADDDDEDDDDWAFL